MIRCIHQVESVATADAIGCANTRQLLHGGLVPRGTCEICPYRVDPGPRGVGDRVAGFFGRLGVTPQRVSRLLRRKSCGCDARKAFLNRWFPKRRKKPKAGRWACVVTTAPRAVPTVDQCVASLRVAGWDPIVFAEPGSPDVDAYTIRNLQRLGVWHNWLQSCRWALEQTTAGVILTVQDDSVFHHESKEFAESILWPSPHVGFLSLYTPKHYSTDTAGRSRPRGVNRVQTGALWGACALVWPREVLQQLVEHPRARNWLGVPPRKASRKVMDRRRKNPALVQNSDTAIGLILNAMRREMWTVDPSPVRHVAQISAIGHGGNGGKRNCGRCADPLISLADQVPRPSVLYALGDAVPDAYRAGMARSAKLGLRPSFAISLKLWRAIEAEVDPLDHTCEFGVGVSTSAFTLARRHTAFEENPDLAKRWACASLSPLRDGWYDQVSVPQPCRVVLIDGPHQGDRSRAVSDVLRISTPDAVIFVDDTHRPAEAALAAELSLSRASTITRHDEAGRSWSVIRFRNEFH